MLKVITITFIDNVMKKIDYKYLLQNERNYFLFYIIVFSACSVYYLFQWPIKAGDTDLWYHLNGGRYFFDHYTIPHDSFFSFIIPARKWVDYYWLFQVFVYKIHAYSGYYGLVCLRALLFMGLMFFIFRYFARNLYERRSYFAIAIMFSLYVLILLSRYAQIRPYMFSDLFIVLFIYFLEYRQKMAFILTLLALLWVNIHGIFYPVMFLIALAYLSEFVIKRIKEREETGKEGLMVIIPLVLILFTVYCTPHGIRLIGLPLTPTGFASHYIIEMQKFSFIDMSSLNFTKFVPTLHTVFVIIVVIACFACIHVVFKPRRRIAHLILFAGGLFLLTRGKRFGFEFILLAMPVIKDALSAINVPVPLNKERKMLPVKFVFMCFLSIVSLLCLQDIFKNLPRFPVSNTRLPHGVATFLQKIDAGGAVLNSPDTGGYLQWALYPKYKIFTDMEVPFFFTDEDMGVALKVFSDYQIFSKMLALYDPPFISVPINIKQFQQIIKMYPRYKPVFFDDNEALYINERYYPLIAEEHLLKFIDPLTFSGMTFSELQNHPNLDMVLAELERMHSIDPDIGVVNRCLSAIYQQKGEYSRALIHADAFIQSYPESDIGYALKGSILGGLKKYDEALKNFKNALEKTGDNIALHRAIGLIYFEQKRYGKAYDRFIQATDIYSPATSYKDLYYIIYSASKVNMKREALVYWQYGVQMLPPDDKEWNDKYKELQLMLAVDNKK